MIDYAFDNHGCGYSFKGSSIRACIKHILSIAKDHHKEFWLRKKGKEYHYRIETKINIKKKAIKI
jgi:hypothetical protein